MPKFSDLKEKKLQINNVQIRTKDIKNRTLIKLFKNHNIPI